MCSAAYLHFPWSPLALTNSLLAVAILSIDSEAVVPIAISALFLIAGCILPALWKAVHVVQTLFQRNGGSHEVRLLMAVDSFLLINLAAGAGVYLFWLFDSPPDRNSQFILLNDSSVWVVYVRALYASGLVFGTGGVTQFVPISVGSQLYFWALIVISTLNTTVLISVAAGRAYELVKERRKRMKQQTKSTRSQKPFIIMDSLKVQ